MTLTDLGAAKANVPWRTERGRRQFAFPVLDGEVRTIAGACSGCTKRATHEVCESITFPVPFGERRHDQMEPENVLRVDDLHRVMGALWALGMAFQPMDNGELVYNAGGANNATQFVEYEIVSASGSTLTLRGRNPKRIGLSESIPNPDWPASGGVFTTRGFECAIPAGAQVQFLAPSVLATKLKPWIVQINPPSGTALDDVTFTVELSANVANAREPEDLHWPASTYRCRIWWRAFQPETWPRIGAPEETQFGLRDVTTLAAAVTAGKLYLRRTDGTHGRVIFPAHLPGAVAVAVRVGDVWTWQTGEWVQAHLHSVQLGYRSWETWVDVSSISTGAAEFRAVYYAETVEADGYRLQMPAGCANCQQDRSGSYAHHDGWRCTRVQSSGFANFRRQCWQPQGAAGTGCDGFSLGFSHAPIGPVSAPLEDLRDGGQIGQLWQRSGPVLVQGIPGYSTSRNFAVAMPSPGGASLASLCGGWADTVPEGFFARRVPMHAAALGQYETFTDVDGVNHRIVTGLYAAAREWTAGTAPSPGVMPTFAAGWTTRVNARGETIGARLGQFPTRGAGRTHLYEYAYSGAAFGRANQIVEDQEAYALAINPAGVNAALAASVRGRFE